MRIAVLTLAINDWYYEVVKYGVKTAQLYAEKHSYDFHLCNEVYSPSESDKRGYPWYKIKAIQKYLPLYDAVLWIDADGFIMRPEQSVEYFLHEFSQGKDMVLARDYNNVLNTGVMFIRNTPFVHTLLDLVWNNTEPFDADFHEQASMGQIYENNRLNSKEHITILPLHLQHIFYCYWSVYWPEKTFFLHSARCFHDPVGFVYTMDCYCPIRMDEDTDEEYKERMLWLQNAEKCRADIDESIQKNIRNRPSTRSKLYSERFYKEGLSEKWRPEN